MNPATQAWLRVCCYVVVGGTYGWLSLINVRAVHWREPRWPIEVGAGVALVLALGFLLVTT